MGVAPLERPRERRLVVDIGGGSTEVILGEGMDIKLAESFSIGTQRQNVAYGSSGTIRAIADVVAKNGWPCSGWAKELNPRVEAALQGSAQDEPGPAEGNQTKHAEIATIACLPTVAIEVGRR